MAKKIAVFADKGKLSLPVEKHDFFENPLTVGSARLSGCKNISLLDWIDDKTAFAVDWGIRLNFGTERVLAGAEGTSRAPYAAFRAHYLELCTEADARKENVFTCHIKRVIEDAFSFTVYFEQKTPTDGKKALPLTGSSLIHWELSKSEWKKISENLSQRKIYARIPSEKLMRLEP